MKKFLTVLLALSVVFTYTVGTAFAGETKAAVSFDDANLIKAAANYAREQIADTMEEAYKALAKANPDAYTTEEAYKVAADEVAYDERANLINLAEKEYLENGNMTDGWKAHPEKLAEVAEKLFGNSINDDTYSNYYDWFKNGGWSVTAAKAQFKLNFAGIIGLYDEVAVDTLYSKTTPADGETYYEQAVKAIADSKAALTEKFFDEDGNVQNVLDASATQVEAFEKSLVNDVILGTGNVSYGVARLGCEKYEGTDVVKYYYIVGIPTMDDEEVVDADKEATTAALKAKIAANVAAYVADKTATAPAGYTKQDIVDIYTEIFNYLAKKLPKNATVQTLINVNPVKNYPENAWDVYADAVEAVEELEAFAAKYAAEKDATGAFVRDAEKVAEIVDAAKLDKYAQVMSVTDKAIDTNAFETARDKIKAMTTVGDAAKLAFDKEVEKARLDAFRDANLEKTKYYALEEEQVNAVYEEAKAKVDANEDNDFRAIERDLNTAFDKILTAAEVDALFNAETKMGKELDTQKDALLAYIEYKNSSVPSYDEAFINGKATARELIRAYYIENDARTLAEMKALTGVVEAVAATLPTTGELAAAKKAATDAIAALPAVSKITSADKEAFQNAYDLAEAYNKMAESVGSKDRATVPADKLNKLADKLQADINLAFAKADKKDKAALKAIAADVEALNDVEMFTKTFVDPTVAALKAIKDAEKAAVIAALKALPINVTLADKAQVEAARALYDAYVAEYTDPTLGEAGYVAAQFDAWYHDLALAEAAIAVLQAKSDIEAVESLKVVKNHSVAGKGYIKIAWSVKGDAAAADGYQIYRATKANGKYTKFFTTSKMTYKNTKSLKKGTKYYYKVRAYKTVDGVKYYSDWSNKAYRVAK